MSYTHAMLTPAIAHATQIPILRARKAALDLAGRFEDSILAASPADGVFGPERTLVTRFDVSPKVVRQALRILESRFLGTVRRGVRGGLLLRTPGLADSAELMAIYLSAMSVDRRAVVAAMDMLLPEMADRTPQAQAFVRNLLTALDRSLDDNSLMQMSTVRSRALVIARRIVLGHKGQLACATDRVRLGTLIGLEEQHASGRPVILQAIRILEELEIVEARLGRGGGIEMRQPSPGAVVRAIYPHFVLGDLTLDTAKDIMWSINRALAVRAAGIRTPDQARMLDSFSASLQMGDFHPLDHSAELTLWRMLADMAGNDVLHMLVRCLFYFRVRSDRIVSTYLARPASTAIRDNLDIIAQAVSAARPAKARQAIIHAEAISRQDLK